MNKLDQLNKYEDYLEDYYREDELSELEAHVLSGKVERKARKNRSSIRGFIKHLIALKNYMLDRNVKWYKKSVVVAAILYFLAPLDAIPDVMPLVGYLDDMGVILWTVKFMGNELNPYYE
jgi:uncharacterized membrane protein YkvA (DUF1232 family)